MLAYAQSIPEIGKARMLHSPVVGFGRVTSFYYDPIDYRRQQHHIWQECRGEKGARVSAEILTFIEQAYKWSRQVQRSLPTRETFPDFFKKQTLHHAHSRGAIVYSYWGEPIITKKLRVMLASRVSASDQDATLSLLSTPMRVKGPLQVFHHASSALEKRHVALVTRLRLTKQEKQLVATLRWFTLLYELGERVSGALYETLLHSLKRLVNSPQEYEHLLWYDPTSLQQYFLGQRLSLKELRARQEAYVLDIYRGHLRVESGFRAKQRIAREFSERVPKQVTVLRGTTAHPGFLHGKVRIVITREQQEAMRKGEVLVSTMTTPYLMEAVRKAAAIVTDEGGLTAHAAIVARELNIPCIVGTKVATKVFKDGDLVEVDAIHGSVRKI